MRRPVKPFVTEYRGGSRRANNASGQGPRLDLNRPEADRADARPAEPWGSALSTPPAGSSGGPQEDGYEAALRAADALFSGQRQPAAAADGSATAEAAPPHPSGGRILRAIDETPSPELARLEAEHAPKRRGRKPGSKNKPKFTAEVTQPAVAVPPPPSEAPPHPIMARVATLPAAVARIATPSVGPRSGRYAWVRTKLKPGEQWKRRIPKVAW